MDWTAAFSLVVAVIFWRATAEIAVLAVCLAFLFRSFRTDDWHWVRTPWFLAALAFWVYLLVVVTPQAHHSMVSLQYALGFIRWPLFAMALGSWLLADVERRSRFEIAIAAVVVFIIADSLLQYVRGADLFGNELRRSRLTGPFEDQVPGTYTLRIFFIAAWLLYFSRYLGRHEVLRAGVLLVVLAVGATFMFLTGERVAFLSFLLGCAIVLGGLVVVQPRARKFTLFALPIIALFTGAALATQPRAVERTINSTIKTVANLSQTPYGATFAKALSYWKRSPWVGIGFRNYRSLCLDENEAIKSKPLYTCAHPHSIYLQVLTESGVIGLALFCLTLGLMLWSFARFLGFSHMLPYFAFAVFFVTFWPFMSSKAITSGWINAIVWMGLGWTLAATKNARR